VSHVAARRFRKKYEEYNHEVRMTGLFDTQSVVSASVNSKEGIC
jgi:hypothetical protein